MSSKTPKSPKIQVFRSARWSRDHLRPESSRAPVGGVATQARPCAIKEVCQTCHYINDDYAESLQEKFDAGVALLASEGLTKECVTSHPIPSPRPLEYRTHAKLVIRPAATAVNRRSSDQRFAIGLFQPNSHRVVDLNSCPLHRHSINRFLTDLREELEASSLSPYDEESHSGDLRYISVRASHLTEELMITYVINSEACRLALKNLSMKLRQRGHLISSAHINLNDQQTNVIFGNESKRLLGSDRLREELCGLSLEIGPSSFFQVNPWQAEKIYRRIEQIAGDDSNPGVAWDLYCGIGVISMTLARAGYLTLGIEENPQAVRDAQRNLVRNDLPQQPNFMTGRVEGLLDQLPSWASEPKLIVVNPSRRGLDPEVRNCLKQVLESNPETRLIYMSCEVKTLTRDLKDLLGSKRKLRQLEGYDMFPYTQKLEWLAIVQ